ncbi:MAG: mannose-6-phosphate isomerase, class I [Polyangiaceae bacterium]|nr:mannose-6-phosphate isomerase, class I [Polyangiaceae bacterium]
MPILFLTNKIQAYAWGSHSTIAELQQRVFPTATPEAEMWLGAHPNAPSQANVNGGKASLDALIAEAPGSWLGPRAPEFQGRLPFLLKVLAAETPLSLQAHPNQEQARLGFEEDEARGIPKQDPRRRYQDANHKPELLCALTPFEALCGFRNIAETLALFRPLQIRSLAPTLQRLANNPTNAGLKECFTSLLQADTSTRIQLVEETLVACEKQSAVLGPHQKSYALSLKLHALYPHDIGILSQLLLNFVELSPGDAIYLPAGNLHAYVGGAGIEIMASSDNVLRGGLTPKPVHTEELLKILDFSPLAVSPIRGVPHGALEKVYPTPAKEFQLSQLELHEESWNGAVASAEIWLCTRGTAELRSGSHFQVLTQGQSAVVSADVARLGVRGNATLFRATLGR